MRILVSTVCLLPDNRVILLRDLPSNNPRDSSPHLPFSHVERYETFRESITREMKESINATIAVIDTLSDFSVNTDLGMAQGISYLTHLISLPRDLSPQKGDREIVIVSLERAIGLFHSQVDHDSHSLLRAQHYLDHERQISVSGIPSLS